MYFPRREHTLSFRHVYNSYRNNWPIYFYFYNVRVTRLNEVITDSGGSCPDVQVIDEIVKMDFLISKQCIL